MTDTTLKIDGHPGAYQLDADDDWDGYMGEIEISDCSHGGSIAQVTVTAYGDATGPMVSTALELTPGDVDKAILMLARIRATIEPEVAYADDLEALAEQNFGPVILHGDV